MSLSRQMGLGFFFVLLAVFFGTLWVNIENTKEYIEQQLESHAQDTATSLGLSISPHIGDENSLPIVETMMQAIFDRGYYASFKLQDRDKKLIISLDNPNHTDDVPNWFVSAFPLTAPTAYTELSDGWTMQGRLTVKSNTGYGYSQLFANAKQSLLLFTFALVIALGFVWYLTKHVLSRPISGLLKQMDDISQQRFETIDNIPKTPELKRIAVALNLMTEKLALMFKQVTEQSERYRQYAYMDSVTQLGNRRAFQMSINKMLVDDTHHFQGYLFIIKATSLGDIHSKLGGQSGDEYLRSVADIIRSSVPKHLDEYDLFRISGADFALVIQDIEEKEALAIAEATITTAKGIEKTEHIAGVAHIGLSEFNSGITLPLLLERVDSALAMALESESRWEFAANTTVTYSNEVWREKIKNILEHRECNFVLQPIAYAKSLDRIAYHEWFARLPDSNSEQGIPMAQLVPASIRLNYAISLDKLIVEKLFSRARLSNAPIGMNISRFSLLNKAFTEWLLQMLRSSQSIASNITLEIPERTIVQDFESITELVSELKEIGVKIAVEHYGAQLAGIVHLRKILPHYLKLDGRYIRGIDSDIDNQLFVNSLISIAKGLSIKVIAEMVESEAEYQWLKDAGADFIQGYFISAPVKEKTNSLEP